MIATSKRLPPAGLPVWLYNPQLELEAMFIGCRTKGRSYAKYDKVWWSKSLKKWFGEGPWPGDYKPTHWQTLPVPPRIA